MKTTWAILGLGWLGQALNDEIVRRGGAAWGTHRHEFDFAADPLPSRPADVLFLNTPPLRTMNPSAYVRKVAATSARRVIFISSTSVYDETGCLTEASVPRPRTPSGEWLVAVESGLRAQFGDRLTIVRPGGLIGGDRHPVYFLSRSGAAMSDAPVNLVHRTDLIGIVLAAERAGSALVNAVAPHHPLKSVYYNEWAKRLGLPLIAVSPGEPSHRVIDSDVLGTLDFTWTWPELDRL